MDPRLPRPNQFTLRELLLAMSLVAMIAAGWQGGGAACAWPLAVLALLVVTIVFGIRWVRHPTPTPDLDMFMVGLLLLSPFALFILAIVLYVVLGD